MVNLTVSPTKSAGRSYLKDSLVNGQPAKIRCIDIDGQTYVINRGPVTVVSLEDDWYEDVRDPERVIEALKGEVDFRADIFSFWQRPPDASPKSHIPDGMGTDRVASPSRLRSLVESSDQVEGPKSDPKIREAGRYGKRDRIR